MFCFDFSLVVFVWVVWFDMLIFIWFDWFVLVCLVVGFLGFWQCFLYCLVCYLVCLVFLFICLAWCFLFGLVVCLVFGLVAFGSVMIFWVICLVLFCVVFIFLGFWKCFMFCFDLVCLLVWFGLVLKEGTIIFTRLEAVTHRNMSTTWLYRYYRWKTNPCRGENFYRYTANDKISPIPTLNALETI